VPFTDLEYRDHDDGHRAVLLTPLIYHSGVTPDSPWAVRATVPAGYCTDFASVPRWLWVASIGSSPMPCFARR